MNIEKKAEYLFSKALSRIGPGKIELTDINDWIAISKDADISPFCAFDIKGKT